MRNAVTLALVCAATVAVADPSGITIVIDQVRDPEAKIAAADLDAAFAAAPVTTALARCKAGEFLGWVVFQNGKAAQTEVGGTTNRANEGCVARALRKATSPAKSRFAATLKITLTSADNHTTLDRLLADKRTTTVAIGMKGDGPGAGAGTGDFVKSSSLDDSKAPGTGGGGTSSTDAKLATAKPDGDFGGLTADEINRAIQVRAGTLRVCYSQELKRNPDLAAGKVMMRLEINGEGAVAKASISSSTLANANVESCLTSQARRIQFPAKGSTAIVNYPFVFAKS